MQRYQIHLAIFIRGFINLGLRILDSNLGGGGRGEGLGGMVSSTFAIILKYLTKGEFVCLFVRLFIDLLIYLFIDLFID